MRARRTIFNLLGALLFFGVAVRCLAPPAKPQQFNWLQLGGDADGNGWSWTNMDMMAAGTYYGDGSHLTGLPHTSQVLPLTINALGARTIGLD